jgi:hypothetical protein
MTNGNQHNGMQNSTKTAKSAQPPADRFFFTMTGRSSDPQM